MGANERNHARQTKAALTDGANSLLFTGFPVNAEKSTSGKLGDLCMRQSKSTAGIYDLPVPRPPPFLSTTTRPAIIRFGTR